MKTKSQSGQSIDDGSEVPWRNGLRDIVINAVSGLAQAEIKKHLYNENDPVVSPSVEVSVSDDEGVIRSILGEVLVDFVPILTAAAVGYVVPALLKAVFQIESITSVMDRRLRKQEELLAVVMGTLVEGAFQDAMIESKVTPSNEQERLFQQARLHGVLARLDQACVLAKNIGDNVRDQLFRIFGLQVAIAVCIPGSYRYVAERIAGLLQIVDTEIKHHREQANQLREKESVEKNIAVRLHNNAIKIAQQIGRNHGATVENFWYGEEDPGVKEKFKDIEAKARTWRDQAMKHEEIAHSFCKFRTHLDTLRTNAAPLTAS